MKAGARWTSSLVRGNCLFWALRQWRRRGGYLVARNADLASPFLHFAWMPPHGRYIYHFRPLNQNVQLPWPWLRGYIQRYEDGSSRFGEHSRQ